jgi:hypothetical protein
MFFKVFLVHSMTIHVEDEVLSLDKPEAAQLVTKRPTTAMSSRRLIQSPRPRGRAMMAAP